MSLNENGDVSVCVEREYRIFDALPPWLRKIIREAVYDVHVEEIAKFYVHMKQCGYSTARMSTIITTACMKEDTRQ